MLRRIEAFGLLTAGLGLLVSGCGGSGGASDSPGIGSTADYGMVTTRAIGSPSSPVIMGSRNAVFTGVFGASFTDVKVRFPPASSLGIQAALALTTITADNGGQPVLYDYGSGTTTTVGPINYWGNTSSPSISGQGTRMAVSQVDTNGRFQIFTMALDGTARLQLTNGTSWATTPSYSPDGSKVAFVSTDSGTGHYVVMVVSASGGAATTVTSTADNSMNPSWTPDGSKIAYFRQVAAAGNWIPTTVAPNGTGTAGVPTAFSSSNPGALAYMPNSRVIFETATSGASYLFCKIDPISGGSASGSTDEVSSVSVAPIGNYAVIKKGGSSPGIYVRDLNSYTDNLILSGSNYNSPEWGPYMTARFMVGPSGAMGATAGGFIFGQLGNGIVKSFVTFDATTRSTITVTPQSNPNPNQSLTVCTVNADSITSLIYMNDLRGSGTAVAASGSPISGAVLSFSSDTGNVVSVSPYIGTVAPSRSGGLTFSGKFVGAYDAKGKNLAPSGASQVTLNPTTGELMSIR